VSLFAPTPPTQQRYAVTAESLIPPRGGTRVGAVSVSTDTAMRHSAVWACLRLRANLISTMPLDVFRLVDGIQVEMPKPPVLVNPGGERVDILEWMFSSQMDLDRAGNTIGLITERNGLGLPGRIDLQPIAACSVVEWRDRPLQYRIDGKLYPASSVWHERQYTVPGLAVGLSPVAYAAWSIGQYQSAQQFALDWYGSGGIAKAHLKNTAVGEVDPSIATLAKERYKAAIDSNDLFVSGKDWELSPVQSEAVGTAWLDAQQYGVGDVARFFDVPGDLIDAVVSTGHVTYASISQRNLQLLIMHIGPPVIRREHALSRLLPRPRYVKLNTSALLRMDDEARARVVQTRILSRTLTPNEGRELENLPPLTDAQVAEFDRFWPPKAQTPAGAPPAKPAI
jgi:HK97 family phage portal protein